MFKSMKSKFNRILLILLCIDVHQKQDLLPVQVRPSVCMPTNCTCAPSYPEQHMKQWASMLSRTAPGCVTHHTHHASVTHFRPIMGNIVEVTLVTSPKHVYNSHTKETYFP